MDIAAIDGVACTNVTPDGPCGTLARQLGALPPGQEPTELIYCWDPDGPANPNGFAQADHCDHIHVGFRRIGFGLCRCSRPSAAAVSWS